MLSATVTSRVRTFLAESGSSLEPWSGLDEVYVELYALLNRRRDDPSFWPALSVLLHDLVQSAVDPTSPSRLPAPQAELLASWDVEALVADLRRALPGHAPATRDPRTIARFASRLSATVMGGFLLLGLAAAGGCSSTRSPQPAAQAADTRPPSRAPAIRDRGPAPDRSVPKPDASSWATGCGLDESSVIWKTVSSSKLPAAKKRALCACFRSLDTRGSSQLVSLFQTGTAEEIASTLEQMVTKCAVPSKQRASKKRRRPVEDALMTPVYKGASFPS